MEEPPLRPEPKERLCPSCRALTRPPLPPALMRRRLPVTSTASVCDVVPGCDLCKESTAFVFRPKLFMTCPYMQVRCGMMCAWS